MAVTRMAGSGSPLMTAWAEYQKSEEYYGSLHAGLAVEDPKRVEGAMWAAFVQGFKAAGGQVTGETST